MTTDEQTMRKLRALAVEYCADEIKWYEKVKKQHLYFHTFLLGASIILSSLMPVLILATDDKILQAVVAALTAIAISLDKSFHLRENYAKFSLTSELLKGEKIKLETTRFKTEDEEDKAIRKFVEKMNGFVNKETNEWSTLLLQGSPAANETNRPKTE